MKKMAVTALFLFSSFSAFASAPFMGRCHMGGCKWIRIEKFELLKENGAAKLYKVDIKYGYSDHQDKPYPKHYSNNLKIDWNIENGKETNYILCNNKMPSILRGEKLHVFDFTLTAGAVEIDANEYMRVCYNASAYSYEIKSFVKRHNLKKPSEEFLKLNYRDDYKIKSPTDLFTYIKK